MIAESEAIRNHVSMTDATSKPPLRWFERNWVGFVSSFLVCFAATGISMFLRFTLADSLSQRIEAGIFSGFLFGGLLFVFFIGPVQLVVILLLRWLKIQPRWRVLCSQVPAGMVFIYLIRSSLTAVSPSGEQKWFEQAVGVPIPPDVKLVHAEHGLGLQDRRGLWLLEGEPAAFDRLVAARGWWRQEQEVNPMAEEGIRRAAHHFGKSTPWIADAIYFWAADKEATKPPFGMSCLLTDKERKRWAVWVVD